MKRLTHPSDAVRSSRRAIWPLLPFLLVALGGARCAAAQCTGEGTVLVPGQWEVGPPLPCEVGGTQIAWVLYTPPHHESVPALGSTFAGVRTLPQLFVRYRCTGFWLWPTQIAEVKTLGYVFDVRVRPCDGGTSVGDVGSAARAGGATRRAAGNSRNNAPRAGP